jgi:mono/diheme cytochrome c family protein
MRKLTLIAAALVVALVLLLWALTIPATVPASALPPHTPDLHNGRTMFDIGGCASCHATPAKDSGKDPGKADRTRLGGGLALPSPFGTFYVPNISPDAADGVGAWSEADFVTALWKGTSPRGKHLFPAFPYTSYQHMELADLRDLFAYLKTLPPVTGRVRRHDLVFPFHVRRLVGFWKLLFFRGGPFVPDATKSPQWNRGAYLVNGLGHCAECHSPRNFLGGIIAAQRFAGGPNPEGEGWVPNITQKGLGEWSVRDFDYFLETGNLPDGDNAGGSMARVIKNTSQLPAEDQAAMAEYLKSLPPVEGPPRPPKAAKGGDKS